MNEMNDFPMNVPSYLFSHPVKPMENPLTTNQRRFTRIKANFAAARPVRPTRVVFMDGNGDFQKSWELKTPKMDGENTWKTL